MDERSEKRVNISVVIPFHNEEQVLPTLVERLLGVSRDWGEYEVIFVDDGSTDRTLEILKNVTAKNRSLKAINSQVRENARKHGFSFKALNTLTFLSVVSSVSKK